jgi:uncharacterized protein (UPF0147 family)
MPRNLFRQAAHLKNYIAQLMVRCEASGAIAAALINYLSDSNTEKNLPPHRRWCLAFAS